eukprot:3038963-Rhodomonas_salina.2
MLRLAGVLRLDQIESRCDNGHEHEHERAPQSCDVHAADDRRLVTLRRRPAPHERALRSHKTSNRPRKGCRLESVLQNDGER